MKCRWAEKSAGPAQRRSRSQRALYVMSEVVAVSMQSIGVAIVGTLSLHRGSSPMASLKRAWAVPSSNVMVLQYVLAARGGQRIGNIAVARVYIARVRAGASAALAGIVASSAIEPAISCARHLFALSWRRAGVAACRAGI